MKLLPNGDLQLRAYNKDTESGHEVIVLSHDLPALRELLSGQVSAAALEARRQAFALEARRQAFALATWAVKIARQKGKDALQAVKEAAQLPPGPPLLPQAADKLFSKVPPAPPVPMRLHCPACGQLHVDQGEFAIKSHHTHACQHCGAVWRPAIVNTVGVQFLPGFKNDG